MEFEKQLSLCLISDLHGNISQLEKITEKATIENRTILCAGDYLSKYVSDDGNNYNFCKDEMSSLFDLCKDYELENKANFNNIHHGFSTIGESKFIVTGWGGSQHSIFQPYFNQGHYYDENTIVSQLSHTFSEIQKVTDLSNTVLLTHQPVTGYISTNNWGKEIGSSALRTVYDDYSQIGVIISGHSHNDGFKQTKMCDFNIIEKKEDLTGKKMNISKKYSSEYFDHEKEIIIEYDKKFYDLTCFLNPGSLGYSHSMYNYIELDLYEENNSRKIEIVFDKID